ncbi:MAG: hypothetical protein JXR63_05005 [Spirochaetales bacterium]|nr:hypothetical protein [Spirochaetales bacterium]
MKKMLLVLGLLLFSMMGVAAQQADSQGDSANEQPSADSDSSSQDSSEANSQAEQKLEEKEKKKMELKSVDFELRERVDFQASSLGLGQGNFGWNGNDLYNRLQLGAKLNFGLDDFGLKLWAAQRLDLRGNLEEAASWELDFQIRSRTYLGIGINYSFSGVKFSFDNEFRLESEFKDSSSSPSLDFRYAPTFILEGKHDFGLSWSLRQMFGFHAKDYTFSGYDFEGEYKLNYVFYKKDKVKLALDLSEFYRWRNDKIFTSNPRTRWDSETFAGLQVKYDMLTAFLGFYNWFDSSEDLGGSNSQILPGFSTGLKISKKNIDFGICYKGVSDVMSLDKAWVSEVSTEIKLKF